MKKYITFDIGGTAVKYGIINENGELESQCEMATKAYLGGPDLVRRIIELVKKHQEDDALSGICISTGGIVDTETGTILYANPNIPNYTGIKLKELLEKECGIPCEVENDVVCAGIAELYKGEAAKSSIGICLTIGTGIGCCIMIEGKVLHGFSYSAGEVGYMNMFGTQFEKLASSSALVEKVSQEKGCQAEALDGVMIFEMAKAGDKICIDAIEELCDKLGYGIANICYVLNPEVVVLGGGISAQREYLYERVRESLDKYLIEPISKKTKLLFASQGNCAGMLGAYFNFCMKHQIERENERI